MIIRPHSDLHIEFNKWDWRPIPLPEDKDSVLVLAGDVCSINGRRGRLQQFLEDVAEQFKAVVYVAGNHEFYNQGNLTYDWKELNEWVRLQNLANIHLLENQFIQIDNVVFIGATLWTDYDNTPSNYWLAQRYMADYSEIRYAESEERYNVAITPEILYGRHLESKKYIFRMIEKFKDYDDLKTVVVTHHGCTKQSTHKRFKHDTNNFNFVSELTNDILQNTPDLWIHGHIHDYMSYTIEGTNCRVVANPRGYPQERRGTANDESLQLII